jgi:hypothetical protein
MIGHHVSVLAQWAGDEGCAFVETLLRDTMGTRTVAKDGVLGGVVGDDWEDGGAVRFVLWRIKVTDCHGCWRGRQRAWSAKGGE